MENAKTELLEDLINMPEVKCAKILNGNDWNGKDKREIKLKVGFTTEDWADFLNNLNFDYDSGYGSQELFGTLWFNDGSWLERHEYDGAECWHHKDCPDVPSDLI
jgi:hypothetical protein|tara:strand:+ start:185 stop:499 length:315 start_codon:yes stop_codon:yes gene_type:complete